MNYPKETFQYGTELELGDVDKRTEIPEHLGKWEWCEHDIINMLGEFRGIAADPSGEDCHMGGEINTVPTVGWPDQLDRIMEIIDFFPHPTMSHYQVTHIHMHIPGLTEDGDALRRLAIYSANEDNRQAYINACFRLTDEDYKYDTGETDLFGEPVFAVYEDIKLPGSTWGCHKYLDYVSTTKIPDWYRERLPSVTNLFELIDAHKMGESRHESSGSRKGMPMSRAAVNLYPLGRMGTLEFRAFRGSLDRDELRCCFEFCEEFVNAALNTGESVQSILDRHPEWKFPKIKYERDIMVGYVESLIDRKNRIGELKADDKNTYRVRQEPNNI